LSKLQKTLLKLLEKQIEKTGPAKQLGIKTDPWFWFTKYPVAGIEKEIVESSNEGSLKKAFETFAAKLKGSDKIERGNVEEQDQGQGIETTDQVKAEDWETQARQIILDNPKITAGTLINTMKSKGIVETDSASSNAQYLRSDVKKESNGQISIHARFLEGSARNDAIGWTRFRVVLLQEGLGNLKDAFYYSKEALESAITIFEGKKIYADHPTEIEEINRPERSVKDVLGHFENIELVTNQETGQSELQGDVVILPDEPYRWARGLLRHAVQYSEKFPDKDFVGLSINANGEADQMDIDALLRIAPDGARSKIMQVKEEQGLSQIRVVKKISSAVSCDLVTEAGAGGKITKMIEKDKSMQTSEKENQEGGPGSGRNPGGGDSAKPDIRKAMKKVASIQKKIDDHEKGKNVISDLEKQLADIQAKKQAAIAARDESRKRIDALKAQLDAFKKPKQKKQESNLNMKGDTMENEEMKQAEQDTAPHADAEQDIELIKKMIAEYLGEEQGEEEKEMAMEAYEAYSEMGYKADEATKLAVEAVKLAKHMAAKQAKKESEETEESGEQKEEIPQDEMQMKKEESASEEKKECDETKESCDTKKESNQIVELTGKIALLESQIKTFKMKDHLDKTCRESGLPMSATKMFKDLDAVKTAKTEDEITKLMGVFKESFKAGGGEADNAYKFLVHAEKVHNDKANKKINLTECLR
jgi:hypothetical protein